MPKLKRKLDDWLDAFLFYTKESECPTSYLTWSGLHTLSAITQRRISAPWVYYSIYPNLYIMLIGPPGVTHKNSAIRFSRKALRAANAVISSDAISKEALIQMMMTRVTDEKNAVTVAPSEFATFMRTSGPPMVEFLTDIFDSEENFEYTTKGSGTQTIPAPFLTMFTGATPGWMSSEFDRTFIEGGFASRTLFIAEVEPRFRKAFAHISDEMRKVYRHLIEDLLVIREIEGEFVWTQGGHDWFEHWYEKVLPTQTFDHRLTGYHGRKAVHLLKIAQLVCINKGTTVSADELILDEEVFSRGLELLESIEPNMVRTFRTIGDNPYSTDLQRIADDIRHEGRVKASVIYGLNIHVMEKQTIDEIMMALQAMGLVGVEMEGAIKYYTYIGEKK